MRGFVPAALYTICKRTVQKREHWDPKSVLAGSGVTQGELVNFTETLFLVYRMGAVAWFSGWGRECPLCARSQGHSPVNGLKPWDWEGGCWCVQTAGSSWFCGCSLPAVGVRARLL